MAVLDDLKTLTNLSDTILNIYIRRANVAIRNYLNLKDEDTTDISSAYPDAVIQFVTECIPKKGNEGIKQFMQGSRQGTFINGLSDDVKALLPSPYISMLG